MTNVHPFRPKSRRRLSADLTQLVTGTKSPATIAQCVANARCAHRLLMRRAHSPEAAHVFRMFRTGWMQRARALKTGQGERKGA